MNITLIGGGNTATLLAGEFTKRGHKVTIYTRDKSRWNDIITVYDNDTEKEYTYKPEKITEDIPEAVSHAQIIIVTLPAFAIKKFIESAEMFILPNTWIGFYPGTGGVEFISKKLIEKGCVIFGPQRITSVVRLKEYGKYVITTGKRKLMHLSVIPSSKKEEVREVFSNLFDIETELLPNYLNVTLTPSNPILHPARLYTLYKDYQEGMVYKSVPLFYENWTDETSEILIKCDNELHQLLDKINLDTSKIMPLLTHYESTDAKSLTNKIRSIKGFMGLESPKVKVDNGFIPDLNSRYFTADFPYGLIIIKSFAMIYNVSTPQIDEIIKWYQKIVNKEYINFDNMTLGKNSEQLNIPQLYGINTKEEVEEFYKIEK